MLYIMKEKQTKDNGVAYDIPVKGSLGLLALGDRGLRAWREVKEEAKKNSEKK